MRGVNCLVGDIDDLEGPLPAFCDEAISFLSELSRSLLHDAEARSYPDVASFAYWCRKANLKQVADNHASPFTRLGRGFALHIAPANVPVNFAFTYAFSLLAGNPTVVRVSSREFGQVDVICRMMGGLLESHPAVAARTAIVRYPSDAGVTEELSLKAAVRVVWGGDATVAAIRSMASAPRCVDIAFPDRYSLCVMDGGALESLGDEGVAALARSFYNDTYAMDQNACSSPHVVFWRNGGERGRERFWEALASLSEREYDMPAVVAMDKFDQSCRDASELAGVHIVRYGNWLYRAQLSELPIERLRDCTLRGVGGYFYECDLHGLGLLAQFAGSKYQTLTYFGVDPSELQGVVVDAGLSGIDRIVPVGSSLDIGTIWDGHDLIAEMSRIVDAR